MKVKKKQLLVLTSRIYRLYYKKNTFHKNTNRLLFNMAFGLCSYNQM